jgi:hypothetical protein
LGGLLRSGCSAAALGVAVTLAKLDADGAMTGFVIAGMNRGHVVWLPLSREPSG